jgi:MFS family permease
MIFAYEVTIFLHAADAPQLLLFTTSWDRETLLYILIALAIGNRHGLHSLAVQLSCLMVLSSSLRNLTLGYLNSVAGPVNTIFYKIYPEEYPTLPTTPLVPSIVFVGLVLGQLLFGYISDSFGRRVGMVAATVMVILFSALCAGSWYPTVQGMMIMFTIWRFCLGIGIGSEYPAGSVAASEATAEVSPGRRHALFILVTNFVIDLGFVIGNMVPCLLVVYIQLAKLKLT